MDLSLEPMDLTGQRDEGKSQTDQGEHRGNLNLWGTSGEHLGSHSSAPWGAPAPSTPGSTEPAGCMDGAGEQREEFGRRREPNTISWGCRAAVGAAVNPLWVAQILMEISPRPSLPSSLSHPSSRLPHSRQGMCCWRLSPALLSLSHTHTQGAAAAQPPLEWHQQHQSHLASKCCSLQVFFPAIPTAQTPKERI